MKKQPFNLGEWFKLPLNFRQRYWRETDYGRNEPSDELRKELEQWLTNRANDTK